jgi:hypothetical protein
MRKPHLLAKLIQRPSDAAATTILLNCCGTVREQTAADDIWLHVSGALLLVASLASINPHNIEIWQTDWTVVMAVLGPLLAIGVWSTVQGCRQKSHSGVSQ